MRRVAEVAARLAIGAVRSRKTECCERLILTEMSSIAPGIPTFTPGSAFASSAMYRESASMRWPPELSPTRTMFSGAIPQERT